MHDNNPRWNPGKLFRSPTGVVLLGFLVIAGFFLVTEHTAHFFGALPYLLLLCCPLMMLFMHGGHGGESDKHAGHSGHTDAQAPGGTN